MTAEQPKHHQALRNLVNRSGFPFQLAVEHHVRETRSEHGWDVVHGEYPAGDGFIDVLLRRDHVLAALECKNTGGDWIFPIPAPGRLNEVRCRAEFYNGRVRDSRALTVVGMDEVFCGDFNMCEGSPEAQFAVTKQKGSSVPTLEAMSSELLAQTHALLATWDRRRAESDYEVAIPVIVTSGHLYTCVYTPTADHLTSGELEVDEGAFSLAEFVRFRKSLVGERSNHYEEEELNTVDWYADRERTVFVVQARSLASFLSGFRSFTHNTGGKYPPEYTDPPNVGPGWLA